MLRRSSASVGFVLAVVLSGLNALCLMGVAQAAVTRAGPPAAILQSPSSLRGELQLAAGVDPFVFSTEPLPPVHVRHVSPRRIMHALLRLPAPASLFRAVCASNPEFDQTLLARENVLPLGDAPRAPGLGRAPPAA